MNALMYRILLNMFSKLQLRNTLPLAYLLLQSWNLWYFEKWILPHSLSLLPIHWKPYLLVRFHIYEDSLCMCQLTSIPNEVNILLSKIWQTLLLQIMRWQLCNQFHKSYEWPSASFSGCSCQRAFSNYDLFVLLFAL